MGWVENTLRGAFLNSLNEKLSSNKLPRSLDALISMCVRIDMEEYGKQVPSSRWFQDGGGHLGNEAQEEVSQHPMQLGQARLLPFHWRKQQRHQAPGNPNSFSWSVSVFHQKHTWESGLFFSFLFFISISISCGADRLGYMVLILQLHCCCGSFHINFDFYLLESKWVSQGKLYVALPFLNDCLWKHLGQLYFWLPPWSSDTIISFFTVRLPPHFLP